MPEREVVTLCIHFGTCGGCTLQDLPDPDYRARKRDHVVRALAREGLGDAIVEEVVEVPPRTRRRAVLKAKKAGGKVAIGFHAARAHTIVDMHECLVLTPGLFRLVAALRETLTTILRDGEDAELHVTEADNGLDLALRWKKKPEPALVATLAHAAAKLGLVRVTAGRDVLFSLEAPVLRLGNATVTLPPEAFLQPTRAGEEALQRRVRDAVRGAKEIADLFAGCGTFTFPLALHARVHAVELERTMLAALAGAARAAQGLKPVTTEPRDLFRRPLDARELGRFDAVVLDPPRAGAKAQATALAGSDVRRIAYVSCDAESFARDARLLVAGGYLMGAVLPVDQFLWSEHIELVAAFERVRGKAS